MVCVGPGRGSCFHYLLVSLRLLADIKWFIGGTGSDTFWDVGWVSLFCFAGWVLWQIPWGSWSFLFLRFLVGSPDRGVSLPYLPTGCRLAAARMEVDGRCIDCQMVFRVCLSSGLGETRYISCSPLLLAASSSLLDIQSRSWSRVLGSHAALRRAVLDRC